MSDADMAALVGPDKMALLEWKFESNQRRQRLHELNTRLNTASSLAMVKRIVEEMDSLYRKEKILPHLLVEVQIAWTFCRLMLALVDKRLRSGARPCTTPNVCWQARRILKRRRSKSGCRGLLASRRSLTLPILQTSRY
jgi:hypothetical protein